MVPQDTLLLHAHTGFLCAALAISLSVFTECLVPVDKCRLFCCHLVPKIKAGTWYDHESKRRKTVTQYHEVVGYFLGPKMKIFAQVRGPN
jgi:hypothetical protein